MLCDWIGGTGREGSCLDATCNKIHKAAPVSYTTVHRSEEGLLEAIVKQPVSVEVNADSDDFQFVSLML